MDIHNMKLSVLEGIFKLTADMVADGIHEFIYYVGWISLPEKESGGI